jgi:cardiolipin synthase
MPAHPRARVPAAARSRDWLGSLRLLGEQSFSRAAGAPLVEGNRIRLLRDATENYPAWLAAIERAERSISFESYILADDRIGNRFADALAAAARRRVRVRLLQDWLGARGEAGRGFWRRLREAGVEVRWFNPFRPGAPLAVLRRNHRKSIVVDGRLGFVTGLCIADRWAGSPEKGIPPWRDTGVELEGPAIADLARAFARGWTEAGGGMDPAELPRDEDLAPAGETALRIIATEPTTAGIYRLDQLIAATARRSLWLTDAYFVGVPSYVQALRAAALDGVDVRVLVPGASDLVLVKRLGVAGYRPLLEAGIRVFEWNGPMLHAKTAVADCRWARVGSTNLNLASWMGNWELDVAAEDGPFAGELERCFEADLANATEIVLGARRRRRSGRPERGAGRHQRREGSAVATAGAIRLGNAVSAALGGHRVLGPAEATLLLVAGLALVGLAALALAFPRLVLAPAIVALVWLGLALLLASARVRRESAAGADDDASPAEEEGAGEDGGAGAHGDAGAPPGEDGARGAAEGDRDHAAGPS